MMDKRIKIIEKYRGEMYRDKDKAMEDCLADLDKLELSKAREVKRGG